MHWWIGPKSLYDSSTALATTTTTTAKNEKWEQNTTRLLTIKLMAARVRLCVQTNPIIIVYKIIKAVRLRFGYREVARDAKRCCKANFVHYSPLKRRTITFAFELVLASMPSPAVALITPSKSQNCTTFMFGFCKWQMHCAQHRCCGRDQSFAYLFYKTNIRKCTGAVTIKTVSWPRTATEVLCIAAVAAAATATIRIALLQWKRQIDCIIKIRPYEWREPVAIEPQQHQMISMFIYMFSNCYWFA